jgi:hypothetical protein
MKLEHYKSMSKGKPKRKSKLSKSKSRMLAVAKEWKPFFGFGIEILSFF